LTGKACNPSGVREGSFSFFHIRKEASVQGKKKQCSHREAFPNSTPPLLTHNRRISGSTIQPVFTRRVQINENRNPIETQQESGEARTIELQALDDASIEPAAVVERGQDFQNTETIQANLTAAVECAASVGATPLPIPHTARDIGATPLPIPQPEDKSVLGSLPTVRGDLDQLTAGTDDGRHDATPITLPGPISAAGHRPDLRGISARSTADGSKESGNRFGPADGLESGSTTEHEYRWE
jgi:hypothetical protein